MLPVPTRRGGKHCVTATRAVALENCRHFATPATVAQRNDVWETSGGEIPYWWSFRSTQCLWLVEANFQPIRSTTQIGLVTRHQYGISPLLVSQMSFRWETVGGVRAKCQLFSQATARAGVTQCSPPPQMRTGSIASWLRSNGCKGDYLYTKWLVFISLFLTYFFFFVYILFVFSFFMRLNGTVKYFRWDAFSWYFVLQVTAACIT